MMIMVHAGLVCVWCAVVCGWVGTRFLTSMSSESTIVCVGRTSIVHTWRASPSHRVAHPVSTTAATRVTVEPRDTEEMGRSMHAIHGFSGGESILREAAILHARCCTFGCPGCATRSNDGAALHSQGCFWAPVEQSARLAPARSWFFDVCGQLPLKESSQRANHIRVCCLLGMCIQAAANEALRAWLLQALRPSCSPVDPQDDLSRSTRGFADKFSIKIARPEAVGSAGAWAEELFLLLLHLQTNLFEIDEFTIGIFPSAFLYQHSCSPNARLRPHNDGSLSLVALKKIATGETITFDYTDQARVGTLREDVELRRRQLQQSCGFHCMCASCLHDEGVLNRQARVFLEVSVGGRPLGRITIRLREDMAPRCAENFRALCTGERGVGRNGRPLHYRGTTFHRVIKEFMCQGGAQPGESIYGASFADERPFRLRHDGPGVVSMANSGADTNASGFFITCAQTEWNDGKHVVFGRVVSGMEVVRAIEAVGSESGEPTALVQITDCGQCT